MWTTERVEIAGQLFLAIERGQVELVRKLCAEHPWLIRDHRPGGQNFIDPAAISGDLNMIQALLEIGYDINAVDLSIGGTSSLTTAICFKNWDLVKFMLANGADPNLGRPIITALNITDNKHRQQVVMSLIEYGVDLNRLYTLFGDESNLVTALDWAGDDAVMVAEFRARGAKTAAELGHVAPVAGPPESAADAVVAYFAEHFGPVQRKAMIELVPTGHPVALHVIPPGDGRDHVTFFTTGMSDREMPVPAGQEEYRYAELFLQLPATWPLTAAKLATAEFGWPLTWLRKLARYPHDHDIWLGGPVSALANGEPPARVAPGVPFTSFLLLASDSTQAGGGATVQLYRVVPLYTEERDMELADGTEALLTAFDRRGVSLVFDPKRPNVAV